MHLQCAITGGAKDEKNTISRPVRGGGGAVHRRGGVERMIGTHGGAATLALVLLASGAIGQLARWLDREVRRHER